MYLVQERDIILLWTANNIKSYLTVILTQYYLSNDDI
jgi:hypothetical protein